MTPNDPQYSTVIYAIKKRYFQARTQARWRGEAWDIPMQYYIDLWLTDDRWQNTGHGKDCWTFARLDLEAGWTVENTRITTRSEMLTSHQRGRKIKSGWDRRKLK